MVPYYGKDICLNDLYLIEALRKKKWMYDDDK